MPEEQKPSIGRIVHYVELDYDAQPVHRAAIISVIGKTTIGLHVFRPSQLAQWTATVPYSEESKDHTWHWPERE